MHFCLIIIPFGFLKPKAEKTEPKTESREERSENRRRSPPFLSLLSHSAFFLSSTQASSPSLPARTPLHLHHGLCDDPGARARRARQQRGRQGLRRPVRRGTARGPSRSSKNFDWSSFSRLLFSWLLVEIDERRLRTLFSRRTWRFMLPPRP